MNTDALTEKTNGADTTARGDVRPTLRLPPEKKILREQMTVRQLQEDAQAD